MEDRATGPDPLGVRVESVERWFGDHVEGARPPLHFERVLGGHSNLTYTVRDARDTPFILRRPPVGDLLATAHDVTREHRIMAALEHTPVPVPRMLGLCEDDAVTGSPFYVMEYVEGVVMNAIEDADRIPESESRRRAGGSLLDALAALHAVDVDAVGLGDLSRREGYLDRQLKRWSTQWEACGLDELTGMVQLHQWLVKHRPPESEACLVHGDFRLGNTLLAPDGTVVAVLDWELCTLGEPMLDVAYLLRSWSSEDARPGQTDPVTSAPGFPSGDELTVWYGERSGRSLEDLDYWMAFTAWRSAAILGGVYRRYLDGKLGEPPDDLPWYRVEVESRIDQGLASARRA